VHGPAAPAAAEILLEDHPPGAGGPASPGLPLLGAEHLAEDVLDVHGEAAARAAGKAAADARRAARHDGPPSAWRGWFDGSAKPNPGRCGIGARLDGPAGIRVEIARPAGHGNSSEAEYRALIALLEAAVAHGARDLTIHGDSRVVIDDVAGPDLYAAPALAPYRSRVHTLLAALSDVRLRWVPRHKNTDADALSQRALANFSFDESDADDALRTPS
jgi:ribonuclease HI